MKVPRGLAPLKLREVWAAKRFAQVKEEPAQRAGDTEQNALPPRLLVLITLLLCGAAHALDLNQATEAELDGVKGLGPSTTARILAARQAQPFQHWQDFMQRVKGVKAATAAKLSGAGLTIDGTPYAAAETTGSTPSPSPSPSTTLSTPATAQAAANAKLAPKVPLAPSAVAPGAASAPPPETPTPAR